MLDQLSPYLEKKTDSFVQSLYCKVLEVSIGQVKGIAFIFNGVHFRVCNVLHFKVSY